jgi:fumarate reductase subunit D
MTARAHAGPEPHGAQGRRPGPSRLYGLLWALFANAAALLALVGPAHVAVQGVLGPLGLVPSFDRRYSTMAMAFQDPLVRVYVIVVAGAAFYLMAWRLAYVIHELGVHAKRPLLAVSLGLAAIATAAAAYVVLTVPV